jgi:hypothetical protein
LGGAGSQQQSAAGCWIDVDVLTLLIVGTQYALYEIMGMNPIKQGARSGDVDGKMVTKSWFIFGRFAFTDLVVKLIGMD